MSAGTAVERVSAALERAHATQDTINAFISIDDERALECAHSIDQRIEAGEDVGPLAGVPIGLKDLIDHRGRVTTCGSAFYAEVATDTSPCVTRLEQAGAVIIGRTNLHEWAFGFNSENMHWGPVRNPWDLDTSAGGSSGGSGAAVAAGITPISIGTDTGGSVRVPAALCGTFGLKVTHGRIPTDHVFPLVPSIDTIGPLADSMDGIELSFRAMSGDSTPLPDRIPLRFGIPQPWFDEAPMEPDLTAIFESVVETLRGSGHEVGMIDMPDVVPDRRLIDAIGEEVAAAHRQFRLRGETYDPAVESRIEVAEAVTPEETAAAREWQRMIRSRFTDAFGTVDFLLTPATPARRKVIGEEMIGERTHRAVLSYFSAVVNHALLPAIVLPLTDYGSPPASLQVIGPMNSESGLIGFGRWMEVEGVVGFTAPPGTTKPIPGAG